MSRRGNSEGSIYKRTDGRWVAVVTVAGGRGTEKKKYLYGRTRQEVAKKLTEGLKAVKDGVPMPSDRITVAAFARDWLDSVRHSIRPKTYESYEATTRVHIIPNLGRIMLNKLMPSQLERMYIGLIEEGYSPKSVRNYHSCIHAMLEKAVRQGVLVRNVAKLVDLPKKEYRELPMFTPEQARAFLEAARQHRLEALFVLAITTGARQGELLGLTWDRVDMEAHEMEIRQALQKVSGHFKLVEPKTTRSMRRVYLTGFAIAALHRQRNRQVAEKLKLGPLWSNDMNLIFTSEVGTPLDKDNVTKRQFRSVLRTAGLPQKLRFHDLRHIAGSLALGQGVPVPVVSEMLGHSDSSTTLRVYAHAIPGAQRQAAQVLEKVLSI